MSPEAPYFLVDKRDCRLFTHIYDTSHASFCSRLLLKTALGRDKIMCCSKLPIYAHAKGVSYSQVLLRIHCLSLTHMLAVARLARCTWRLWLGSHAACAAVGAAEPSQSFIYVNAAPQIIVNTVNGCHKETIVLYMHIAIHCYAKNWSSTLYLKGWRRVLPASGFLLRLPVPWILDFGLDLFRRLGLPDALPLPRPLPVLACLLELETTALQDHYRLDLSKAAGLMVLDV